MTDTPPEVLTSREDHLLIITINRPEARNSITKGVHVGIGEALELAEHDPDIRVVILTGAGDKSFCAGADLKAVSRGEKIVPDDPVQAAWGIAGIVKHPISKPVIAAVNGFALGGGTEIVLACDLVVAADSAQFGLPEVKRGIIAAAGGAVRMVQQIPKKQAMELLLTGDPISAARALELGLINQVVPAAELMTAARALAARIAVNAPLSVQATKRIALGMRDGTLPGDVEPWVLNDLEIKAVMRSEDAKEGPRAFAEKRAPVWKAR